MHDSDDLDKTGASDAVDQGVGEYLKTAAAEAVAENAIKLWCGHHSLFGFLPLMEKADFKALCLCPVPSGGIKSFLEGLLNVNDIHRSEIGSEVLIDAAPDVLRWNRFCAAFVHGTSPAR